MTVPPEAGPSRSLRPSIGVRRERGASQQPHHAGGAAERRAKYEANAEAARERSDAATQKPAPSQAALAAQLKVLRGGTGD